MLQCLHPDPSLLERPAQRHRPVIREQQRRVAFEVRLDPIAQLGRPRHPERHQGYRTD
jgi:hypothetical protein